MVVFKYTSFILKKDMFRQFQMIQWSEMLNVIRQCVLLPQVLNDIV